MYLLIPLKVRGDGELHLQCGPAYIHSSSDTTTAHSSSSILHELLDNSPGDWLDVDGKLQLGQLVDVLVDGLAHLGHADQLPNLAVAQVVEPVPGEVLLLYPANDVLRQLLELSQWSHGLPPGVGEEEGRGVLV